MRPDMDEILDTRGLKCPLPALKAEKRLESLPAGSRLTVLATDPMARVDIPVLCNRLGHTHQSSEADGVYRFEITVTR